LSLKRSFFVSAREREAEEPERLGPAAATRLAIRDGEPPELGVGAV
jgi:hypothetical protein